MTEEFTPEIIPALDMEDTSLPLEMRQALIQEGVSAFWDAEPDYVDSEKNNSLMVGWLEARGAAYSLHNLQIAYRELLKQGALEVKPEYTFDNPQYTPAPRDKYLGIKRFKSTVVLRHPIGNDAQRQLVGEKPERLEELLGDDIREYERELKRIEQLSEPGKPVSAPLKWEYKRSLQESRGKRNQEGLPQGWAAARAKVAMEREDLRVDSQAFNAEVARVLAETNQ